MQAAKSGKNLQNGRKAFSRSDEELSARMSALDKEVYRLNAQKEKLEESNGESGQLHVE